LLLRAPQRVLDERLDELLADAPRRSVLMIDSGKAASDGGCVQEIFDALGSGCESVEPLCAIGCVCEVQVGSCMLLLPNHYHCCQVVAVVVLTTLLPCSRPTVAEHAHGRQSRKLSCGCSLARLALRRAAANLPWVDILPQEGANVYSILQRDILVRVSCVAMVIACVHNLLRHGQGHGHGHALMLRLLITA